MKVSLIIPTKNRPLILQATIDNLFNCQNFPAHELEVIVVNDGEEELSQLRQKYETLKIIQNQGKGGAAGARNTGAGVATGQLLLFIDDDILIGKDCIQRHCSLHTEYQNAIISGAWIHNPDLVIQMQSTPFGRYKLKNDYLASHGDPQKELKPGLFWAEALASFNLSVLRSDFRTLGGFNTEFQYAGCEDQEFTMRAKANNFLLLLDMNNINWHNEVDRGDMKKWLMRQYTGVQGFPLLCELFPLNKQGALYFENIPIQRNDSLRIKVKKSIKYFLSGSLMLAIIKSITRILERVNAGDRMLFRCYSALCGLYLYKGFRLSFDKEK
jgi:glycosyltransferase involved in cell wall biosynthesis